jgi:hypothetical protein
LGAGILRAFTFGIGLDPGTFCGAGIAVGFVVAATDGVVLHRADAVGVDLFDAFFRGVAGHCCKHENSEEEGVFHNLDHVVIESVFGILCFVQKYEASLQYIRMILATQIHTQLSDFEHQRSPMDKAQSTNKSICY